LRSWWGHLKLKVLAFGVVMSVIPLSVFGWYAVATARNDQVEIVQTQNRAAAELVAHDLARFMQQLTLPMDLLARIGGPGLVAASTAEQERLLYTLLRDVPYLEEVSLAQADGQELVRVSRREVTTGAGRRSFAGTPIWESLGRGPVSLDVDGRPLMQMGVALPERSGALIARSTLRGLMANIAAVRGSGHVRIHVLDETGRLIGDSDYSLVLAGHKALLPATESLPYVSITGEEAVGTVVSVPELGWQVLGETTLTRALAPVRRLAFEFGAAALVLMAAVLAISVVFGLQLTEPLERLEAGAARVGGGELAHRIPAGGRDELGRLVEAFNRMTERLEAQTAAVTTERDRLDTVVSSIGAGLALIDTGGTVVWTNRTLAGWFGGALTGRPCWEALGRPGCTGNCGGEGCRRQGVERQVMLQGLPRLLRYTSYQPDGELLRLEVLEDVTERRSMEAMVRQSEKLAAVGQLAAGVAHEINNPLAVISAYAEELSDRLIEEGAAALDHKGILRDYLAQLQVQVQRCKGITINLLDFARRGSTEPEPVDGGTAARQTAALVQPRARRSGTQVRVEAPDGLPPVRATRDQLQQVFLNLVTNSLDAMEDAGSGAVTISAAVVAPDRVRFTVSDTGPGMDAETLNRALEPFFTTKPPGRGTGLGLSTCYGIITGLGGDMGLTSAPGEGTAVTFELPVWRDE